MTARPLLLFALVAIAACRAPASVAPEPASPAAPTATSAAPLEAPPPPERVDLGASERDHEPLFGRAREEIDTKLAGPPRLFGARLAGGRPDAPGRTGELMVAIDSPYQVFGTSGSYVHVAAWRSDGQPAARARVYQGREAVGRTDATGSLVFAHAPAKKNANEGWDPSAIFVVDGGMRCGAVDFNPYGRTKTFATDRLYVYTDRGVFQPGDTVHLRIIGWRLTKDYRPLEGAQVEILLRDRAGHSIAATTAKTDAFGVTAADLAIPLTAVMGDYELRVAYGRERAKTRLQVRRFDPPPFRLEHTLGRYLLRAHQGELRFAVTAHPPGSSSLGKARLEATLSQGERVVATITRDVQGEGPHALAFDATSTKKLITMTPEGQLARVSIRLRDTLGRETTLDRELQVTAQPYVGVLELDRDQYATGDPVSVVARLSDRDSVPLRHETVALKVAGKTITAKTDGAGMAQFRLAMPNQETPLSLHFGPTQIAKHDLSWRKPQPMRSELASPVVKERQSTKVLVRFPAGHSPTASHVHMDIVDTSGAIVGAQLLPLRRDARGPIAEGEFVAPSWGSMLLTFFALGRRDGDKALGLMVSGQNLVVQTDRELHIELQGLPERVKPGSPLDVTAKVTTRQGAPAEVSLGAALVDRNVLALKDPLEITPMDRFYNPTLRTLATTGSKILTWPVVSRNWGERVHDVALPPWDYLGGGDLRSCRQHWDDKDFKAAGEQPPGGLSGTGQGFGSGHGALGRGHRNIISIRTKFPTTALWEPHLRGTGTVAIRGRFPDSIGEQELIVVASDKRGGVGVVRQPVAVQQPVHVRADLPALVAGEEVEIAAVVQNDTAQAAAFEVEFTAGGGHVQRRKLQIAAKAQGAVALPFSAAKPGELSMTLRAVGAGFDDRVARQVTVSPAGAPVDEVQHGQRVAGHALMTMTTTVAAGLGGAQAHLRVELPAVTAAFADLAELAQQIGDDPWSLSSDLTSAAVVLQLAARLKVQSAEVEALRGRLAAAVSMAQRVQGPHGAFAYWRNGTPSAYITARVLAGLLEARAAGIPVPDAPLLGAATVVAKALESGAPIRKTTIGWWEGDEARVREGLTAEMFGVLARLPVGLRQGVAAQALSRQAARHEAYLKRPDWDALTAGRAVSALLRLGRLDATAAGPLVDRMIAMRDEAHWEPSWVHAFAGRVDATLAVLEALQLADPAGRQADKRDALGWILATRGSWGAWHAPAATAAALRAIALVGAAPEETAATMVVRLDGQLVPRHRGIDRLRVIRAAAGRRRRRAA
jgi:MG2 domain/Alpha-2-macroglobulin family